MLPVLKKVKLRNFSLYSAATGGIDEKVNAGVYCLAGANGIGKSTFLAAVNYAMTGMVVEPGRDVVSFKEFYSHSLGFSAKYFSGRIEELDRNLAEVYVELEFKSVVVGLSRGIFDKEELRSLKIVDKNGTTAFESAIDSDGSVLNQRYKNTVCEQTGVSDFSQFVFLQLLVRSFDEERRLLFWDQPNLQRALYLAFGVDPEKTERADNLKREIERADSRARNARWKATEQEKHLTDLRNSYDRLRETDLPSLDDFKGIEREVRSAEDELRRLDAEANDAFVNVAEFTARLEALKVDYDSQFREILKPSGRRTVDANEYVQSALHKGACGVCGSKGDLVSKTVAQALSCQECPFCKSTLEPPESDADPDMSVLKELARKMANINIELQNELQKHRRLKEECERGRMALGDSKAKLAMLEDKIGVDGVTLLSSGSNIALLERDYQKRITEFLEERDQNVVKREHLKKDIAKLHKEIEAAYLRAEHDFVPRFRELAYKFTGLDLDIVPDFRRSGLNLVLEIAGTQRREHHQLSESQRFFVDIALRMSLVEYMARPEGMGASLFIDTPEGSLDIAYEAKAGEMFAAFVNSGNHLVMTANINTSQLLLELAHQCGSTRMHITRMTSWAELSDVQRSENERFERAFSEIERAMQ